MKGLRTDWAWPRRHFREPGANQRGVVGGFVNQTGDLWHPDRVQVCRYPIFSSSQNRYSPGVCLLIFGRFTVDPAPPVPAHSTKASGRISHPYHRDAAAGGGAAEVACIGFQHPNREGDAASPETPMSAKSPRLGRGDAYRVDRSASRAQHRARDVLSMSRERPSIRKRLRERREPIRQGDKASTHVHAAVVQPMTMFWRYDVGKKDGRTWGPTIRTE
ncbi:hypothetical protein GQ53DRAFT_260109 [Thozetella sp. PMI_491]|nr:hypothetical protein GQ53DRAFT_260109 [Thozetella sp. PMI_491]